MHFSTKDILQPIHTTWLPEHTPAAMLRLDQLDPFVSGNKWFKLKYNLEAAKGKPIVTFGGAWSNHILAAAAACKMKGLRCTGIIRGERPPVLSSTLEQASSMGMQLVFVSREEYRVLTSDGSMGADDYMYALHQLDDDIIPPDAYLIPEGGHNALGVKGCSEILALADTKDFTHIICSVGTGTTMAGLINATVEGHETIVDEVLHDLAKLVVGSPDHVVQKVVGISALKGAFSLQSEIESLLISPGPWELLHDFHEGGYGKMSPALIDFMNDFYRQTGIPLDRVYTGKMVLAVKKLVEQGYFPENSRLLLIHSGGLQGNDSLLPDVLCF
ncbi:pyridoxal-phosphate dependent enzyme [Chitinophaga sp. SYP-B3965]|uniref:1-aminocyclopropane-1-carboxylate deaminase/D-cysteine desulfhydrase n=1 Tax=Chitinophaga sp. SYP-B3965 TaxID=2663120 RepID=UPI001299F969|nr:pyridoxal-phosphate dependent enzyme [Chitinophaga sp. SYP-B3965]MRG45987.1 pyridoxal-phosphate dependent enzyme [Chitinophaga sp. SYP-B3965]